MDSTLTEKREMRAGVGRMAPLSIRLRSTRQRVQTRGLTAAIGTRLAPRLDGSTTRSRGNVMWFVRRPSGNGLVEGVGNVAPGCRTQTGHARRFSCGLAADGGSIPPASTILANTNMSLEERSAEE